MPSSMPKKPGRGNIRYAARPEGEAVPVLQDEAGDFAKAQSYDGQVVAAQPQDRESQQDAEKGAMRAPTGRALQKPIPKWWLRRAISISAGGVKSHVAQVEHPASPTTILSPNPNTTYIKAVVMMFV